MKDYVIITCYQFDITDKLIKLMGRDKCLLVVDNRDKDEFNKFKSEYGDLIISSGPFGYYTSDEALGRINMIRNLLEVTKGKFDRVHIISQNDLPTKVWINRESLIEKDKEYIHLNVNGWMSNYMTVTPELCKLLESHYYEVRAYIFNYMMDNVSPFTGAISENIWPKFVKDLPNRVNSDLRFYVNHGEIHYGLKSWHFGKPTKSTSPFTFRDNDEAKELLDKLDESNWYLFSRKFDYKSDIYMYQYNKMWSLLHENEPLPDF